MAEAGGEVNRRVADKDVASMMTGISASARACMCLSSKFIRQADSQGERLIRNTTGGSHERR